MGELLGIARFKFHDGSVEEYKRLNDRAMEIVRTKDTGTLEYKIYFNDDESEAVVIERYTSSQALIEHGEHLGDLSADILATADVEGELLGDPSEELREKLADSPVRILTPYKSL